MKFNVCHMCHIKSCGKNNCIYSILFLLGSLIILSGFFLLMYGLKDGMKAITEKLLSIYMWIGLILILHVIIKISIYPSYKETKGKERTMCKFALSSTILLFVGIFLSDIDIRISGLLIALSLVIGINTLIYYSLYKNYQRKLDNKME